MVSRHLGCAGCRIRVRAGEPAIDLLEGCCPICGEPLIPAASASGVLGFRAFAMDALSEPQSSDRPDATPQPLDLVARRDAGAARHELDSGRGLGGSAGVAQEAALSRPAAH